MSQFFPYFLWSGLALLGGSELNDLQAGKSNPDKSAKPITQPNVIIFATDDLNDWVTPLGYKQAITPNMDRLARQGRKSTGH